ncbi:MAG TPA: MarR family transcriptional regulator [Methanocella sp.]|nr:MarR family transcriptional regulator [Methanocella sp.]
MGLEEGKLHFCMSLVFLSMCEITGLRKGKKGDLSLLSMGIIRDSIFEKIQVGDIVRRNDISYGTATECVITLEKKGYIRRVKGTEDGRAVYVEPTDKARQWFDELEARTDLYVKEGLSRLSTEEQATLIELLSRFTGYDGDTDLREQSLVQTLKAGRRRPIGRSQERRNER